GPLPRSRSPHLDGWGPSATPLFWYSLYWGFAAGVLLCLARLAWVRGADTRWRLRWRAARPRVGGPTRRGGARRWHPVARALAGGAPAVRRPDGVGGRRLPRRDGPGRWLHLLEHQRR